MNPDLLERLDRCYVTAYFEGKVHYTRQVFYQAIERVKNNTVQMLPTDLLFLTE
jgi:hypothetical protein